MNRTKNIQEGKKDISKYIEFVEALETGTCKSEEGQHLWIKWETGIISCYNCGEELERVERANKQNKEKENKDK